MKRSEALLVVTILVIFSSNLFAQISNSLELSGGIVMPKSASKGVNTTIKFDYPLNENIQLYIYTGYSSWDKDKVIFTEEWSTVQEQTLFTTYTEDNHTLIPLYLGSRINLNTNGLFNPFVTLEAGYAYLSYNHYENDKIVDNNTGEVLDYYADKSTKKNLNENLIGLGAGIGISHQLTEKFGLLLSYKLNTHINSEYYDIFSGKSIYSTLNLGLDIKI
jgi:hypothetical protein